mgnify:FL=1
MVTGLSRADSWSPYAVEDSCGPVYVVLMDEGGGAGLASHVVGQLRPSVVQVERQIDSIRDVLQRLPGDDRLTGLVEREVYNLETYRGAGRVGFDLADRPVFESPLICPLQFDASGARHSIEHDGVKAIVDSV